MRTWALASSSCRPSWNIIVKMVSESRMLSFQELFFNVDNGYLEALVRGFRSGILKQTDYLNLSQCETLEGREKNSTYSHRLL